MRIIEDIVSNGHGWLSPSYVVIHETANPGATARNHRDHWSNNDDYAVHYVGDWTGDVYHCVPDDRLCWQVGNGNAYVVGIELCHATNQSDFEKVWKVGIEWAAMMLERHGWGVDRLISHYDCSNWWGGSDHDDPIGYFEEYGKSWDAFVIEVNDYMEGHGMISKEDANVIWAFDNWGDQFGEKSGTAWRNLMDTNRRIQVVEKTVNEINVKIDALAKKTGR